MKQIYLRMILVFFAVVKNMNESMIFYLLLYYCIVIFAGTNVMFAATDTIIAKNTTIFHYPNHVSSLWNNFPHVTQVVSWAIPVSSSRVTIWGSAIMKIVVFRTRLSPYARERIVNYFFILVRFNQKLLVPMTRHNGTSSLSGECRSSVIELTMGPYLIPRLYAP